MKTAFSIGLVLVCVSACVAATCPECKRIVPDGQKFCPNCGRQVTGTVTCTKCKKPIPVGQKFCGNCGSKAPVVHAPKPKPKLVTYAPPAAVWDDQAVENAIAKAVKFLWSRQRPDGSWASYKAYPTGATSAAAYALLASGVRVSDKRMAKALRWLGKHETNKVYCLGLRCNAWFLANRQAPGMYGSHLLRDGYKLVRSIGPSGGWHYDTTDRKRYHNSSAQYGVLGAWALARATGEVPSAFWNRVQTYWYRGQRPDGGWGYAHNPKSYGGNNAGNLRSTGSMSAAGLASLFVCFDALSTGVSLECRGGRVPPGIQRGLTWFDKHFANTLRGKAPPWTHAGMIAYYLYGVERVGLASGYKYFGTHDWFQLGARHLMKHQQSNGSVHRKMGGDHDKYGIISETGFAIVFWVRGRYPVVMNKLQFNGDWNNRPRDLANFTRWFERRVELPVTWQIVSFASDPWKWLDCPIMYISGSKAPRFTDAQVKMLGEYVRRGGTIFSVTECGGRDFAKAMADLYKKLFPTYRLELCGPTHDVYSRNVLAKLAGRPTVYELSNGVRPLAIHVDEDLPRAWQMYSVVTAKHAFDGGANIVCYVAGATENFRARNTIPWPAAVKFKPTGSVVLTRVQYAGHYDPEPLALHRFALLAGPETKIAVNIAAPMPMEKLPKSGVKVAALTGTGTFRLTRLQAEGLKKFVAGGGLLVVDAAGGDARFADSATRALEEAFDDRLRPLARSSPLLTCKGFAIPKAYYRRKTVLRTNSTSKEFNLRALLVDEGRRIGVLFSRDDITGGLIGAEAFAVDGYSPATAYRIMRNVVLHAAGRR